MVTRLDSTVPCVPRHPSIDRDTAMAALCRAMIDRSAHHQLDCPRINPIVLCQSNNRAFTKKFVFNAIMFIFNFKFYHFLS